MVLGLNPPRWWRSQSPYAMLSSSSGPGAGGAAGEGGPRHVVKTGKTPVLSAKETRALLDGIDVSTLVGLRDRALLGVLVYSFARVSAAVSLSVADYYTQGPRSFFRLHEKG